MKLVYTSSFQFSVAIVLLISTLTANAQDIHFSQFNNSPANLNPALTGVFGGDLRFVANYRSQWSSVPVDYRTLSGAFDSKLYHKAFAKNGYLGYGLVFNNDVAGDAQIGISQVGANLSFTRQLSDALFASIGTQIAVGQRSVSPEKLSYEEQWNGDIYDPNLSNGESFSGTSKGIGSISTGLNLHYQVDGTRTKVDLGSGIFHLNQPNTSFDNDEKTNLPIKFSPYLMTTIQLTQTLDLRANGLFSKQLSYQEAVAGAAIRYHFSTVKDAELNVQAGIAMRFGDALVPSVEVQYRNWTAGFSYDQNFSPFNIATYRRGGPEFFLQYILWKVHPPKEFKACPIF
ncbi:MAG: PorP/SprF family type IX secretion system membrane protein [Saprospiraceae bacterium]|nr:PorP/SprF family type IX secretion system membrane protein [Saprospiraceae bacterium]MCF8248613.1 PorP/SprF family type IX secretion system membrane protein [Saprospiraceae bacterium]MCF8281051.1 PorP/SprF family type IX secretion system membrane protein [Bacteroidales bacterium]MCF8310346.1 PorP/SprF family type IX secretion system membrane protein [Saprospiraceae bacterium]MCF8442073.1 PorP/SprF family type IX secretion system membrane protein [Saprospiraceae bacterium]